MLTVLCGDAVEQLRELPAESVQCCVTSPPFWGLRDYGHDGQLGLEKTPEEYVAKMVEVFREVLRVLRKDGTLWLNLGDSYNSAASWGRGAESSTLDGGRPRGWRNGSGRADGIVDERGQRNRNGNSVAGLKPKDLVGIPWMVALALRSDGWWLRQDIIWHKPSCMPESVTDRCTKSHEYIFLLTKSSSYYFDNEAIKEPSDYPDDDRKGRSYDHHKSAPTQERNGIRPHRKTMDPHANYLDSGRSAYALRNKRSVWSVSNIGYAEAHFATYPPDLIKPCILAGSRVGDTVLDPFAGSGTTGMVALELGRKAVLIELNPAYVKLIEQRCNVTIGLPLV